MNRSSTDERPNPRRFHLLAESARRLLVAGLVVLSAASLTACQRSSKTSGAPLVLLFNGSGTSPNDVTAFENLLDKHSLSYVTVSSKQLSEMSETQLKTYRLLLIPGGNFEQIGNGLSPGTTITVRNAIRGGLNYLGVCAGAFFAGNSPYNGLNLTAGVRFPFYVLEDQGIRKAAVEITRVGAPPLSHYWEDGPQLTGWGKVVARYPDGTPAVVQGNFGDGGVVLSGVHPEAPENWRQGMTFATSTSESNAYAVKLIVAALNRTTLESY